MHSRTRRQLAIEKTRELQNTVEHWDKDVGQCCNEFIRGELKCFFLCEFLHLDFASMIQFMIELEIVDFEIIDIIIMTVSHYGDEN